MGSVKLAKPARRMKSIDAGFLYLERPHAPLHIGCLATLDGAITREEVVRHLESRMPRMRRYTQRAVPAPLSLAHPTWEDDPDFDVRHHVFRWTVPSPGGEHDVREIVETLLSQPLARTRPLWEMHVLEGLDGDRTALFQKVHHCMIDGVSGAGLLEVLLQASPFPSSDLDLPAHPPADAPASTAARFGGALVASVRRPLRRWLRAARTLRSPALARETAGCLRQAAGRVLDLATHAPARLPWNGAIGYRRQLAFTRLPMDEVQRIRHETGATVNDVVLTILAGGLRRYLRAAGSSVERPITALVPVSLRSSEQVGALGNRVSALLVPLATQVENEIDRLAVTRSITAELKQGGSSRGISILLDSLELVPVPLFAWLTRRIRLTGVANLIATNVPGPREQRFLGGLQVESIYPIVPITDGLGLGLAVFSYAGGLHIGLNADAERVPDLDKLRVGIEEAYQRLRMSC